MPEFTTKNFVKLLKKHGWKQRPSRDNHITFVKEGMSKIITVPEGHRDMCRPLAKRLLKEAGISY